MDQAGVAKQMLEIEKKYRLPEERLDELVSALDEIGATYEGEDFEENSVYGSDTLDQTGSMVRIRRTRHRSVLTFKRRIEQSSDTKQQIEYETDIADAGAAEVIIRALGLEPRLVYEKKRRTWRRRDVEVVIDVLPFGLFMEIEGPVTGIKETEMLLGIEDLETEHETYPRLTTRLGRKVGEMIESRFNS